MSPAALLGAAVAVQSRPSSLFAVRLSWRSYRLLWQHRTIRARRTPRAHQSHLAAPARQSPRPGQVTTTHNRGPRTANSQARAQVGACSRATGNIQIPNTVGANRSLGPKDMGLQNTVGRGKLRGRVQPTWVRLTPAISAISHEHPISSQKARAIRLARTVPPPPPYQLHAIRWAHPIRRRAQVLRPVLAKLRLSLPYLTKHPRRTCRELQRKQQRL